MMLSQHFSLEEFTTSQTALRMGLHNTPGPHEIDNLKRVVTVMERIRLLLNDNLLHVTSGYRDKMINSLIGGASTSAHVRGLACDFICAAFGTPYEVAKAIEPHVAELEIDQLILEYGWVHIGLTEAKPRHELLTKRSAHSPYEKGINK